MLIKTKKCRACASDIPAEADLCSVCKTPQTKMGGFLQGLTSNITLVVAAASFAVWLVTNLPKMMSVVHPVYQIQTISLNTDKGTIINTGNRPIYVHSITFTMDYASPVARFNYGPLYVTTTISGVVPINQTIEPGKVYEYTTAKNPLLTEAGKDWASTGGSPADPEWTGLTKSGNVLSDPTVARVLKSCDSITSYAKSDPEFKAQTTLFAHIHAKLLDANTTIMYYALSANSDPQSLTVPSTGVIRPNLVPPPGVDCSESSSTN